MTRYLVEQSSLYFICMWVFSGQNVRPLNKHEYILDIATEAESVDANYSFWFRRVIWTQPLKFDNELCVAMHYNQVVMLGMFLHAHMTKRTSVYDLGLCVNVCMSRFCQTTVKAF